MQLSARNQWPGRVEEITDGVVTSEVEVALDGGQRVVATVTTDSVRRLALAAGSPLVVLVKASSVILSAGRPGRISARNQLEGHVTRVERGAVQAVVTLETVGGQEVTATLTLGSLDALGLAEGSAATALFKASHVILAAD